MHLSTSTDIADATIDFFQASLYHDGLNPDDSLTSAVSSPCQFSNATTVATGTYNGS
jgi:hypothetical protein